MNIMLFALFLDGILSIIAQSVLADGIIRSADTIFIWLRGNPITVKLWDSLDGAPKWF